MGMPTPRRCYTANRGLPYVIMFTALPGDRGMSMGKPLSKNHVTGEILKRHKDP